MRRLASYHLFVEERHATDDQAGSYPQRIWPAPSVLEMTNGEIVTDTGAVAAIASPIWLPALHQVSEIAALVLPIVGVLWLAVQIFVKIYQVKHRK